MALHHRQRYTASDHIKPESRDTTRNFMQGHLQIQVKTEHKTTTALPLSLGSGKGQVVQKRDLDLQRVFFLKTKKKSIEVLLNSLPYSQFTPEVGIINQGRPSPPHHYPICREAQPDQFSCAKGEQWGISVTWAHCGGMQDHRTEKVTQSRRGQGITKGRVFPEYSTVQYSNSRVLFHWLSKVWKEKVCIMRPFAVRVIETILFAVLKVASST